jgi:diadenylate cyclase
MTLEILLAYWKPVLEIAILWMIIYHVMLFFEGTRAFSVLRGIVMILLAFFFFQRFDFVVLDWILTKMFAVSVLGILVIFHPEIRQGLAKLGRRHLFESGLNEEEFEVVLKEVIRAAEQLCKEKRGALIALVKDDPLSEYMETGVRMDAAVSAELIQTVFTPSSLLHDGGLVVQRNRLAAGGCLFPLTDKPDLNRMFGTRHRAALGLSEETDAVVIVVSEERQDMSLVFRGKLYKDLAKEDLYAKIKEFMKERK